MEYAKHDGHDDIPSVGQQQKHKKNTRTLTKTSRCKTEQHVNGARSNAESESRDQEELQLSQVQIVVNKAHRKTSILSLHGGGIFFISSENVHKSCIIAGQGNISPHLQTHVSKNHVTEM
nr:MAG TPA: hypothetical protein [Caudoviricetes sp.]